MPASEPGKDGGAHARNQERRRKPLCWRDGYTTAAFVVSIAFNVIVVLLMWQNLLGFNKTKWKKIAAVGTHPGPRPVPYNLFQHITEYTSTHIQPSCVNQSFIAPPQYRDDLGRLLESLGGFKTGVELGVQAGIFSHTMLSTWPSCEKYYLVDLWGQQGNYADSANVDDQQQQLIMQQAQQRLAPYAHKTEFLRMLSTQAAKVLPDGFDFVYVDARHDYCGVWADMVAWWPKVRAGGILAGHDYRGASAVWPHSDWSLCENGTRHAGSVMGAVNTFAMQQGLQVLATWGNAEWSSWIIRKPLAGGACGRLGHTARTQSTRTRRASRYGLRSRPW